MAVSDIAGILAVRHVTPGWRSYRPRLTSMCATVLSWWLSALCLKAETRFTITRSYRHGSFYNNTFFLCCGTSVRKDRRERYVDSTWPFTTVTQVPEIFIQRYYQFLTVTLWGYLEIMEWRSWELRMRWSLCLYIILSDNPDNPVSSHLGWTGLPWCQVLLEDAKIE